MLRRSYEECDRSRLQINVTEGSPDGNSPSDGRCGPCPPDLPSRFGSIGANSVLRSSLFGGWQRYLPLGRPSSFLKFCGSTFILRVVTAVAIVYLGKGRPSIKHTATSLQNHFNSVRSVPVSKASSVSQRKYWGTLINVLHHV